jgi:positive regulator of sigma E activity
LTRVDTGPEVLIEIGEVLQVLTPAAGGGRRVVVRLQIGEHCDRCAAHALCRPSGDGRREIEAEDPLGVAVGDRVRVAVRGSQVLHMSLLLYGLPLLLLLVGVGLGARLLPAGPWRDGGSFLLAVGLAAAALPIVRLGVRRRSGRGALLGASVMTRLADDGDSTPESIADGNAVRALPPRSGSGGP